MALVHTLGKPKRKSRYQSPWAFWSAVILVYLTIIPRARMGYESIAHEAEGRMGY